MATREYKGNAAPATLVSTINASVLTFDITPTTGWPTGGVNGKFWVVINRGEATEEKILCLSRSGSTITVDTGERGMDDTAAATHQAGESVAHCYSAVDAREANEHINNAALDHHTQYMLASGTRHDLTARHSAGTVVPTATPVAIGTALTEGGGSTLARSSHVHTIGAGAINNSNMFGAGVVNLAAIGTAAVGTDELVDLNVTTGKLADLAVTEAKHADNSVSSRTIADGAIDTIGYFSSALRPVFTGTAAPGSPATDQLWWETDDQRLSFWTGSLWSVIGHTNYVARGSEAVSGAAATTRDFTVTFPVTFATAPNVTCTVRAATGQALVITITAGATTTGFDARMTAVSGNISGTPSVDWIAVGPLTNT